MPSSISNSDLRRPDGPWGRTWLLAAGLVLLVMAPWELFWRQRGFDPSVEANDASWVLARARVGPRSTVILGTSRIQAALDPHTWQEERGNTPIQLALLGTSPAPLLEDLAADGFAGLALVEILPLYAFDASGAPEARSAQVLARHRRATVSPSALTEDWLQVNLQSRFVFRSPLLRPGRILENMVAGRLPEPPHASQRPDRWFPMDFSRLPPSAASPPSDTAGRFPAARVGRPATDAELEQIVNRLGAAAEAIRSRGGMTVFLHMPACGPRRAVEEARYPRPYWDALARGTEAMSLHADDIPGLGGYPCYDGSHLDIRHAAAFTRALARAIPPASER